MLKKQKAKKKKYYVFTASMSQPQFNLSGASLHGVAPYKGTPGAL